MAKGCGADRGRDAELLEVLKRIEKNTAEVADRDADEFEALDL